MSDARSEILARVRAATAAGALPSPQQPVVSPEAPAPPSLVDAFAQEAAAAGCVVHGPAAAHEVQDVVVSILRELHAHALLAWGAADLPALGLGDALIERGFQFLDESLPLLRAERAAQLAKLDAVDVGLTGALAGLADTGSLVLASGARRSRLAWLLPPVHVALLPLNRLYASLGDFLTGGRETVASNANVVVVTGPSRTGDIEQVLTRGVHGPGAVHVVLVACEEAELHPDQAAR